jgi:hypothetical protein
MGQEDGMLFDNYLGENRHGTQDDFVELLDAKSWAEIVGLAAELGEWDKQKVKHLKNGSHEDQRDTGNP